jgi:hypothetical protein
MNDVLSDYFGVADSSDLVMRTLTLRISGLRVTHEGQHVSMEIEHHTQIQAISQVNDQYTVWLKEPARFPMNEREHGFSAVFCIGKILFSCLGFSPLIEQTAGIHECKISAGCVSVIVL